MSNNNVLLKNSLVKTGVVFLFASTLLFIAKLIVEIAVFQALGTNIISTIAYIIAAITIALSVITNMYSKNNILIVITSVLLICVYIYFLVENLTGGYSNYVQWVIINSFYIVVYLVTLITSIKRPEKVTITSILLIIISIVAVLNGILTLVDMVKWSQSTYDTLYYIIIATCYPFFDIALAIIIPKSIIKIKIIPTHASIENKLLSLKHLYDNGDISETEYSQKKAEILNQI